MEGWSVRFLKSKSGLVALALTAIFGAIVVPLNERKAISNLYLVSTLERSFVRVVFLLLFFAAVYYTLLFLRQLLEKSQRHKIWLITSSISGLMFLSFALLTWPGYWVYDEFYTLEFVQTGGLNAWQGMLTALWYSVCLYLIPTAAGFVVFQCIVAAIVSGYIASVTFVTLRGSRKRWFWIVILPFLMPSSIIMILYPLRLTLYALILLALMFRLIFLFSGVGPEVRPLTESIWMSLTLVLLSFWRAEGLLIILVFLPLLGWLLWRPQSNNRIATKITATGSAVVIFMSLTFFLNQYSTPLYQFPSVVTPLSTMLQEDLESKLQPSFRDSLLSALDLDLIESSPSSSSAGSYHQGAVIDQNAASPVALLIGLISSDPAGFLQSKIWTFLATNRVPHVPYSEQYPTAQLGWGEPFRTSPETLDPYFRDQIEVFESKNALTQPWNWSLRNGIVTTLLMLDTAGKTTPLGYLFWSIVPAIFAGLAALMLALRKRIFPVAIMALVVLGYAAAVFTTAPAAYYMYYFPVTLIAPIIAFYSLLSGRKTV